MDRAYSTLTVKGLSDDQRTFEGVASTPELDTQSDRMDPHGAKYSLPLPLLWAHDAKAPVGHVTHATVSDAGIKIKAHIVRVPEPGTLRDRLDECWHSVKHGLVRGLSIGFQPLDFEPIRGSRGKHIKSWNWRELSCVVMPANESCTVLAVKRADLLVRTSLGLVSVPQPSNLATRMKLALVDSASLRSTGPPMVIIDAVRYEMVVHRDADGFIASVVLEPIGVVSLPKEPA